MTTSQDTTRMRVKKALGLLIHDFIAHPLIGLTGGSEWAWALHDSVGELATVGVVGTGLKLSGPSNDVELAISQLEREGWHFPARHTHGDAGRGCTAGYQSTRPCPCACGCDKQLYGSGICFDCQRKWHHEKTPTVLDRIKTLRQEIANLESKTTDTEPEQGS